MSLDLSRQTSLVHKQKKICVSHVETDLTIQLHLT